MQVSAVAPAPEADEWRNAHSAGSHAASHAAPAGTTASAPEAAQHASPVRPTHAALFLERPWREPSPGVLIEELLDNVEAGDVQDPHAPLLDALLSWGDQ